MCVSHKYTNHTSVDSNSWQYEQQQRKMKINKFGWKRSTKKKWKNKVRRHSGCCAPHTKGRTMIMTDGDEGMGTNPLGIRDSDSVESIFVVRNWFGGLSVSVCAVDTVHALLWPRWMTWPFGVCVYVSVSDTNKNWTPTLAAIDASNVSDDNDNDRPNRNVLFRTAKKQNQEKNMKSHMPQHRRLTVERGLRNIELWPIASSIKSVKRKVEKSFWEFVPQFNFVETNSKQKMKRTKWAISSISRCPRSFHSYHSVVSPEWGASHGSVARYICFDSIRHSMFTGTRTHSKWVSIHVPYLDTIFEKHFVDVKSAWSLIGVMWCRVLVRSFVCFTLNWVNNVKIRWNAMRHVEDQTWRWNEIKKNVLNAQMKAIICRVKFNGIDDH